MTSEGRGSWYLLTGLILGVALGLLYTWVFSPAEYADTYPASMRADYKDAYRAAIAAAYNASGDLSRAQARLNLLKDDDPAGILAAQSQRYLAEGYSYNDAVALARLSAALGEAPVAAPLTPTTSSVVTEATQSDETPTPADEGEAADTPDAEPNDAEAGEAEESSNESATTEGDESVPTTDAEETSEAEEPTLTPTATLTRTPFLTFTPLPTLTPTATLSPPYFLLEQALVCETVYEDAIIQIIVQNAAGEGVPGVEIILQFDQGEEFFFTGLKPELGLGYADYVMTPGETYSLHIADGGEPVDLFVPECSDEQDERYWGSWRLAFTHP